MCFHSQRQVTADKCITAEFITVVQPVALVCKIQKVKGRFPPPVSQEQRAIELKLSRNRILSQQISVLGRSDTPPTIEIQNPYRSATRFRN